MSLTDDELRRIGGSDAAAVAGVHPLKTSLDVWRRIVEGHVTEDNKVLRRGRLMEPVIRAMAAEEYGLTLLGPQKLRDPKRDHIRANLDDVAQSDNGQEVQEFKSVSPFAAHHYGEGPDSIPTQHIVQCQFYMGVSGIPRARLTALIGVDDLRSYELTADAELQGLLFESVDKFWKDHILTKRPPEVDASESSASWLSARFPKDDGSELAATPEVEEWVRQYRKAQAEADAAGARRDLFKHRLKEFMGEAKRLKGDGWGITWGAVKGRTKTDWKAVCAEARVPEALVKKHTARGAGHRQFRPSWAKEQSDVE